MTETGKTLTPVGSPGRVREWDTRHCAECGRTRVHWRDSNTWHCIGTLPTAVSSAKCGSRP